MASRDLEVTRRIYFYRVQHKDEVLGLLPDDLGRIGNLPFTDDGRYMRDRDGDRFVVWPDTFEYPLRLRFGRTRLSNLPTKELAGKLDPLDLAFDEGLVELCHIIIYDDGYAAAEFNFDGPRIKRLGEYLFVKRNKLKLRPTFLPLFQKDILKVVEGMPVINFLQLKGQPSAASLLSEADKELGHAYSSIGNLGANKTIELGLSAENRPDSKLRALALKLARMSKSNPREVHQSMHTLRLQGFTGEGRTDEIDLLEEHLIALKTIERQSEKSRALSTSSAYEQIHAAYIERRDELADAVTGKPLLQ